MQSVSDEQLDYNMSIVIYVSRLLNTAGVIQCVAGTGSTALCVFTRVCLARKYAQKQAGCSCTG
jgi:hypothetical protein